MSRPSTRSVKVALATALVAAASVLLAAPAGAEPGCSMFQVMPKPVGSPGTGSAYGAVSCDSTTECTAVGPYSSLGGKLSAVTETSGTWGTPSAISMPFGTSTTKTPQLYAISCPAAGTCTAVGAYALTSGATLPLLVTETSGTWGTPVAMTLPAGAASGAKEIGELPGVDCVSTGNCVAVGAYEDTGGLGQDVAETQVAGGSWTPVELPAVAGGSASTITLALSVSCTDTSDCTAIGEQLDEATFQISTVSWTESAGTWSDPVTIPTPGTSFFLANQLACPDATTCLAVGSLETLTGQYPAYATETSGTWGAATRLPIPSLSPAAGAATLTSISCDTATLCEAVGEFIEQGKKPSSLSIAAGAATWSNGTWSSIGYARGVPAGTNRADVSFFTGVSCPSTTACTAIGASGDLKVSANGVDGFSANLVPVRAVSLPSSPIAVTGTGITGGAKIAWQPPVDDGGTPVHTYTATAEPGGRSCTTSHDACALHGLRNGHRYRINVTDHTAFGSSRRTVDSRLVVVGRAPTSPAALRLRFRASDLVVSWHPSSSPAGEPVRYSVVVHGPHGFSRHVVTRGHTVVLAGARDDGAYAVTLVATNASGSSKPRRVRADQRAGVLATPVAVRA
jgi:hypothetical protein